MPKLLSRTPIILAFAIACCFAACSHQADAGIIVDANGIVTEYTLDSDIGDLTAGTTINFFVGSYDDANAAHDLTNEPWVGATYVGSLGNDFRDELRAFTGAPALATDYAYIFATDDNDPYTLTQVFYTGSSPEWKKGNGSFTLAKSAETYTQGQTLALAYINNVSAVPEPSTGVAMGLLFGLGLGGAGFRRRKPFNAS